MPAADEEHVVAGPGDGGRRLDEFLATALAIGRRAAMRLVPRTRVNGRRASKGQRLQPGDEVLLPRDILADGAPAEAMLEVVRETAYVLVLAKPAGLPSVALRGGGGDSLAARIAARFPECADVGKPGEAGLVHRLDTGTSGLLLAARGPATYDALRAQFQVHSVEKEYLALVAGRLASAMRIVTPIGQHHGSRRRMRAVAPDVPPERYDPRPACTDVTPERRLSGATLVRATTTSGVRHQIRVHLASIAHPLLGDPLYGDAGLDGVDGFLLHASRLDWRDPATGNSVSDAIAPPASWEAVLARLALPSA